jgi:hypothetical protein
LKIDGFHECRKCKDGFVDDELKNAVNTIQKQIDDDIAYWKMLDDGKTQYTVCCPEGHTMFGGRYVCEEDVWVDFNKRLPTLHCSQCRDNVESKYDLSLHIGKRQPCPQHVTVSISDLTLVLDSAKEHI